MKLIKRVHLPWAVDGHDLLAQQMRRIEQFAIRLECTIFRLRIHLI